ncbi:MAG: ATP-grasp fold amidoligase family protein [Chitinispirillaceae bacterium]
MVKLPFSFAGNMLRKFLWFGMSGLNDETYIALYYYHLRGRNVSNLYKPSLMSDKLNWLKLNYRHPRLVSLVDKYAVRSFVSRRIGPQYLNELYFVGERITESDFLSFPRSFVLKGTHGSGMNFFCRDKMKADFSKIQHITENWLKTDYYKTRREWAYRDVPRKIICEKLLVGENGKVPEDYKIICFDGVPQFIQVDFDRFGHHTRSFYDTEWRRLPFNNACSEDRIYPSTETPVKRPDTLNEMLRVAKKLSEGIVFSRIDLYNIGPGKVVFGEITLYPGSGSKELKPVKYEYEYGALLDLNKCEGFRERSVEGGQKRQRGFNV